MAVPFHGNMTFSPLPGGKLGLQGRLADALSLIERKQLLRPDLWDRFVRQYTLGADNDGGWRGEFFGKMMRGACMVYQCTGNPALYDTLTEAIRGIMAAADENGRISTYDTAHEFHAWDMWCRKYVLLSMAYYLEICRDEILKQEILSSMKGQADYLLEKLGPRGEGKLPINETTNYWRGLNASSVLISVVRLYELTGEKKYLDFAAYIVGEGGTQVANVFTLAYEDKLLPYQYPITKAYELTSCFEGLLEYYRVTGEEKYRITLERYASRLLESDFTLIGSAGCTHELLDHSTVRQANTTNGTTMQETCVTVTLMIFFYKMLLLTGDPKYADAIETSLYNGYLGALNTEDQTDRCLDRFDVIREPLMFDSYSPLTAGTRGNGIGGFMIMEDRHYYGCCACIGSGGIGLLSGVTALSEEKGIIVNLYLPGTLSGRTPGGNAFTLGTVTGYPREGEVRMRLSLSAPEKFSLSLRIPGWSLGTGLTVNGKAYPAVTGYTVLERTWEDGDEILLTLDMTTRVIRPIPYGHDILMNRVIWEANYMVASYDEEDPLARKHIALRRGPVILAEDDRLGYAVGKPISPVIEKDETVKAALLPEDSLPFPCCVAVSLPLTNGSSLRLTDYGSAGKLWSSGNRMAAWLLTE